MRECEKANMQKYRIAVVNDGGKSKKEKTDTGQKAKTESGKREGRGKWSLYRRLLC
jgi:hypothetical protein